ncbi:MAG: hypothetical protein QOK11_2442, partial [Pseudonocardiales bacterium]|nr:hypothetical protein [Pseudonocardiales bacterium]
NLTGIGAASSTFLSVYPGGTAWPHTSNINLAPTDPTAAVFAVVSVNANRTITVRNNAGLVNVAVDELGYFGTAGEAGAYTGLAAAHRVLDTRTTTGGHHFRVPSNGTVTVDPALPSGASAAVVNVTVTNSAFPGSYLSAAPTCSKASSTLNFTGYTRANMAIVGLDGAGDFCIDNNTSATDVIVDVLGYMSPTGSRYVALPAPQRIVDTRTGNGGTANGASPRPVGSGASVTLDGDRIGDVPKDATALFGGVLEASATAQGYLTVYPGPTKPAAAASTLGFTAGRIVPNAAIIGLSGGTLTTPDKFGIFNSFGKTNVVVDLFGYFLP